MTKMLTAIERQNKHQRSWLRAKIMAAAPAALIVPE
jgi:hypothetical protein